MGFLKAYNEGQDQGFNRGQNLHSALQQLQDYKEQKALQQKQRAQQEAQFRLQNTMPIAQSTAFWRDATPERIGQLQASINADRKVLELPEMELSDAREPKLMEDYFNLQLWAQKRVPFSIVKNYFLATYGKDFLDRNNVNLNNTLVMQSQQMQAQQAQAMPPGKGEGKGSGGGDTGEPESFQQAMLIPGQESPEAAPGIPQQPITSKLWDQSFEEMYNNYKSNPLSVSEAMNLTKVLASPVGAALLSSTEEGMDTIRTIGKMMGVDDTLFSSDRGAYIKSVQEQLDVLNESERRDKNAKALMSLLPKLDEMVQSGADPALSASLVFPTAQALGYNGSPEELTSFMQSIPQISPKDRKAFDQKDRSLDQTDERIDISRDSLGERVRHNKETEEDADIRSRIAQQNANTSAAKASEGASNAMKEGQVLTNIRATQDQINQLKKERDAQWWYEKQVGKKKVKSNYNKWANLPPSRQQRVKELDAQIKAQEAILNGLHNQSGVAGELAPARPGLPPDLQKRAAAFRGEKGSPSNASEQTRQQIERLKSKTPQPKPTPKPTAYKGPRLSTGHETNIANWVKSNPKGTLAQLKKEIAAAGHKWSPEAIEYAYKKAGGR
jgi:hypothetical protein